jgi:peptidyl-prolyl cis-trans isomerase C
MYAKGILAVFVGSVIVTACSRSSERNGTVIARVEGVPITRADFEAKLQEQPPVIRARYATLERKKEFLETLLRFEVLAAEAERQKLDRDPEIRDATRKLMVQRLVRKQFDDAEVAKGVSDSDAKSYYSAHLDEFQKPERLRLAGIFVKAEKGTPPRSQKAAELQKLLARIRADESKNPLAFSNAARDHSEDLLSKTAGGDLGYRTRQEFEKQFSPELASAAFGLRDGQLSNVVETPQGFWILKASARHPALNRPLDEVKAQLVARIAREQRTKRFDEFVTSLRSKAKIEIDDAALESIAVAAPSGVESPGGASRTVNAGER